MSRQQAAKNRLRAGTFFSRHFATILLIALGQLLLRAAALAPLFALVKGVKTPVLGNYSAFIWAGLSALLYLFLVMPLRYAGYGLIPRKALGMAKPQNWYGLYLVASLRRVGVGLLWGLPFIFAVGAWYYAFEYMEFPDFFKVLTTLGNVVGGSFDMGIIVWLLAIVVFGLVFAFGWWLGLPKDFVPMNDGVSAAFRLAAKLRRKNVGAYLLNALVNMLLTLPSLILFTGIVGLNYLEGLNFAGGAMQAAMQLMGKLSAPLSNTTLLYLGIALVLVHLPLCALRKVRSGVLTCRLYHQAAEIKG